MTLVYRMPLMHSFFLGFLRPSSKEPDRISDFLPFCPQQQGSLKLILLAWQWMDCLK